MNFRNIQILELDKNKKGDLFGRLMGDLFHALGYDQPRYNIHFTGRELDLYTDHRTEKKVAIAECKAHADAIGGADINKFIGAFDAESKKMRKLKNYKNHEMVAYFISLSGFKETAIQQEKDLDDERLILLKPQKIIKELISGKIICSPEKAVLGISSIPEGLSLSNHADLIAYNKGWVWVLYFSYGQKDSHFSLIHAEGKPLIKELAEEIIDIDKNINSLFKGLIFIGPNQDGKSDRIKIDDAKKKYFKYLETECGEIQFEGLPTDKDAGSVKVKLENIFIPLHLEKIDKSKEDSHTIINENTDHRVGIGKLLQSENRLAILARPGGGKSTLIKRLAIAYAYPNRRDLVNDDLPQNSWFPIFIRCRELGEKVGESITEIINNIPTRAEITFCSPEFNQIISDVLQKGNALLLIDGLDEIADDKKRINFVNQLRTFLATYPNVNIIVTSREAGFRIVGGSLSNYCNHYKLSNLSNSEIEDLVIKWHQAIIDNSEKIIKEAKGLSKLILQDDRIKKLAENPLLLTTLLFVKRWAGYLPPKKSVLYQEMIKLLLVTWNVEGHDQLDIDETEPQLAFVAYWMTFQGKQNITEVELKDCLLTARNQMPDILSYTNVSVTNFIKRVESRSSLLIMSGHRKLDSGIIPIYEFLHLSFQEHLTAKAIAEKYLPQKDAVKSALEILKPHIANESWKEVVPLVAVLAKRETKELIEFLISEIKQILQVEKSKRNRFKKIYPSDLLGNCLANEIQINPNLLEIALEWYAKSRHSLERGTRELLLNSKFGQAFRNKAKECFLDEYDDRFAPSVGGLLGEIYLFDKKSIPVKRLMLNIQSDLLSEDKLIKCIALLALMEVAFEQGNRIPLRVSRKIDIQQIDLETLHLEILKLLKSNDSHYKFCCSWCLVWMSETNLLIDSYRIEYVNELIELWLDNNQYNINRMISWALSRLLSPDLDLSLISNRIRNFTEQVNAKQKTFSNEYEKLISILILTHFDEKINQFELHNVLSDKIHTISRYKHAAVRKYAAKFNIGLKFRDNIINEKSKSIKSKLPKNIKKV